METLAIEQYVDTSERKPVCLFVSERGTYIRLSASAYLLLERVRHGESFAAIAESICQSDRRQVTALDVEAAYRELRRRLEAIETQSTVNRGGFWFRWRLIPAPLVAAAARRLSWAFHPCAAPLLLCTIAAAAVLVRRLDWQGGATHFWPAYALFLLSLLLHELGHASACSRYGAMPSEIGLTAYLIYPAFYSNVSAAWTLQRWQRVIVDLGGIYFQLVFGAACAFGYSALHFEPLRLCLVFIAGSCLLSLNPILKFDGYWVLADVLGVTNLGHQPARIYSYCVQRLRGRTVPPLPWPMATIAVLVVYTVATAGFWVGFVVRLWPEAVAWLHAYPVIVMEFGKALLRASNGSRWHHLQSLLASTYMLLFLMAFVGRLTLNLLRFARTFLATRELSVGWSSAK